VATSGIADAPEAAEAPMPPAAEAAEPSGITAQAETPSGTEAVAAEAADTVAAQPADPEQVLDEAEHARYQGRVDDALAGYVAAAESYLAAGATDAALDACQRGLRAAPDSASVHLTLTKVYLARGWRERAVEKLLLLDRLLELDGAVEARRELSELARQHVAAEPGLESLAAGTTGRDGPDPGAAPPPG
jgi:tetratricopeptide (TPR) repeat protein